MYTLFTERVHLQVAFPLLFVAVQLYCPASVFCTFSTHSRCRLSSCWVLIPARSLSTAPSLTQLTAGTGQLDTEDTHTQTCQYNKPMWNWRFYKTLTTVVFYSKVKASNLGINFMVNLSQTLFFYFNIWLASWIWKKINKQTNPNLRSHDLDVLFVLTVWTFRTFNNCFTKWWSEPLLARV